MQPAKIQRFVNGFRNNFEPTKPHELTTPELSQTIILSNYHTIYAVPTYPSDQAEAFLESPN